MQKRITSAFKIVINQNLQEEKLNNVSVLAQQIAVAQGLEVLDVKISQQGRRGSLEVTIFKPGGKVSLSDCETVSRQLDEELEKRALENLPVLDGEFLLEVQSPGIDRQLKTEREFKLFAGQKVKVKTKEKVGELGDTFTGLLSGIEDGKIFIEDAVAIKQGKAAATHKSTGKLAKTNKTDRSTQSTQGPLALELSKVTQVRLD